MYRRHIFLIVLALLGLWPAQSIAGSPAEVKTALESDDRIGELFTEVWVLRDLLALQQRGDIAAQAVAFQGLQDQLGENKGSMLDQLARNPSLVNLDESQSRILRTIAERLDQFGIRKDSELSKRLVNGYVMFNQMLRLDGQPPLCELHPFRPLCADMGQ